MHMKTILPQALKSLIKEDIINLFLSLVVMGG